MSWLPLVGCQVLHPLHDQWIIGHQVTSWCPFIEDNGGASQHPAGLGIEVLMTTIVIRGWSQIDASPSCCVQLALLVSPCLLLVGVTHTPKDSYTIHICGGSTVVQLVWTATLVRCVRRPVVNVSCHLERLLPKYYWKVSLHQEAPRVV